MWVCNGLVDDKPSRIDCWWSQTIFQCRDYLKKNVFKEIHNISRHAIHSSEILAATIDTMRELQRHQTDIRENLAVKFEGNYMKQAKAYTDFQIQLIRNLKLRSESNQKRLENEVNLVLSHTLHVPIGKNANKYRLLITSPTRTTRSWNLLRSWPWFSSRQPSFP